MMDLKVDEEEVDSGQPVSIQAFASSSTLHGLSHIFSYERLSLKRVVWALCFLGSLALLALVCTNRIQYYFLYPHVTKLDEVAATRLTFPAVTFCNLNEFRFSRVTKNDLYHAGELLALLNNRYEIPDTQTADEKQLEILQDKANFRNFKPKPFNMLEFYDRAGHDIREMLLSCFFRGEQCTPEDFKVAFYIEQFSVVNRQAFYLLNGGKLQPGGGWILSSGAGERGQVPACVWPLAGFDAGLFPVHGRVFCAKASSGTLIPAPYLHLWRSKYPAFCIPSNWQKQNRLAAPFNFGAVASGESRGADGDSWGSSGRLGNAGCMLMLADAGGDGKSRGSAASAAAPTRRGCRVICPWQKGGLGGDAANANEGLP
ncbi:acid-sensing ion channel 1-like [Ciconia maguari]